MLTINNLSVYLNDILILDEINLHLKSGEKAVIIGESGTGKTTLFRSIIGMHVPENGKILVDSLKVNRANIKEIRDKICYLQQETKALTDQTVKDFLYFPFSFKNNHALTPDENTILDYFKQFNLNEKLLGFLMSKLSGGEKQRMAIIRGLLLKRKLILADEISTALDPDTKEAVLNRIFGDNELTVLAVSHDQAVIKRACVLIKMEAGKIASIERT